MLKARSSLPLDFKREFVAPEWRKSFAGFLDIFDGTLIVHCNGRIAWVSERFLKLLGLQREAVIGKVVEELFPHSLMRRVVETGNPIFWDIMDHGKESCVVMHLHLYNKKKEVVGALGFVVLRASNNSNRLFSVMAKFLRISRPPPLPALPIAVMPCEPFSASRPRCPGRSAGSCRLRGGCFL